MPKHDFQRDAEIEVIAPCRAFVPMRVEFVQFDIGDKVRVIRQDKDGLLLVEANGEECLLHYKGLDLSPLEALARAALEDE